MSNAQGPALSRREVGVVFAGFLAASLVLTLPLALRPASSLPSDLVDTLLNAWIVGWDADRLRHGLRGLWDAPIFFPYRNTLAFSENLLGVAWLGAPAYWASGNAVLAYNVAFWLSFAVAGAGMYVLVRDLARSRTAAAVAGVFYAFCPFRFAQIAHIQMVCTGWLPLALWGLHRYFATSRRRWLAVAAAASALQALSNTYVAYFMAVPIAVVAVDGLLTAGGRVRRAAIDLAVAGAALALLLAPAAASYYRVRADYEQVRTEEEIARGGADVRAYAIAVNGIWRPLLPEAGPDDIEKQLFPGVVAPLLALVALWAATRRTALDRSVFVYAGIALAGLVFSLGPHVRLFGALVTTHGPYEWLQWLLPGMTGMRVPARFAIVFMFGLAVVAGFGAASLLGRIRRPALQHAALAAMLVLIVADGWATPIPVVRYPGGGRPEDRTAADWLTRASPGAVLHLPVRTNDFQELNYQYATLRHRHPIVNGFSGYGTPLQEYLRDPRSAMYDYERFASTVAMLRRAGIRYVVLHDGDYSSAQRADGEMGRMLEGFRASGQVQREERLAGTQALELLPWRDDEPAEASAAIAPAAFTLSASEATQRLNLLVDGDPDTRWIGRQEGTSWVEVHFLRPRDVARVELLLAARSLTDVPRDLEIVSQDERGDAKVLYRSSPYPEFIAGFLARPAYPRLDIRLPPNRSARLAIREVATYPDWSWSIHELTLRERSSGR